MYAVARYGKKTMVGEHGVSFLNDVLYSTIWLRTWARRFGLVVPSDFRFHCSSARRNARAAGSIGGARYHFQISYPCIQRTMYMYYICHFVSE